MHGLKYSPSDSEISDLLMRAFKMHQAGHLMQAQALYAEILTTRENHFDALHLLGVATWQLKDHRRAVELIHKAIGVNPNYAPAHSNLANALRDIQEFGAAVASYDRAIEIDSRFAEAYSNRGVALQDLKRLDEALASCDLAISIRPDYAEAYVNRGNVLLALQNLAGAVHSFDRAIEFNPRLAPAYFGCGEALRLQMASDAAIASYDHALGILPDYAEALLGRANAHLELRQPAAAASDFARAMALQPNLPYVKGHLIYSKMLCCDWTGLDSLIACANQDIGRSQRVVSPFEYLAVCDEESILQAVATIYSTAQFPAKPLPIRRDQFSAPGKIVLGYLCGEFRSQATSSLMAGIWEAHDRDKFFMVAFDSGWSDQSPMRKRIEAAFDEIVDISRMSDTEAAELVARYDVDILVNLNGFFGRARQGVFAYKPAGIQVNYLGFPGTIGATYIDYIICDEIVVPKDSKKYYTEKTVYLPHTYQANDRHREISARAFSRAELGLPPKGFVFCCFNSVYKIVPATFASWMRILVAVPGSVLWLLEDGAAATENLRNEASAHGIDGRRLIFAPRLALSEHLARHKAADLFLDTLPCNAHTTASDALWAGLPVLTLFGRAFPGRVAASLLSAIDLADLITYDRAAYESLAIELARDSTKLSNIAERLKIARNTTPLFDTALFARSIEEAFILMQERRSNGFPPADFEIPARAAQ